MGVVWLVLKIIGITLLCILGLVLLVLALVLFVPIRYRLEGSIRSKQDFEGTVRVHWLLRAFNLRFDIESPLKVRKKMRILWLFGRKGDGVVYPSDDEDEESENETASAEESEKKEDAADKEDASKKEDSAAETVAGNKPAETVAETAPKDDTKEEKEEETAEEKLAEKPAEKPADKPEEAKEEPPADEKPKKKSFSERIEEKIEGVKETFACVAELFSRKKGLLEKYIKKPSTKAAVAKLWKTVLWLLKHIAPRKGHAELTFGMKNPETTGKIFAGAAVLYPWYWKHIDVEPDFGGETLRGEGMLKGRIRLFGIVIRALGLLIDKNIKKMRKEFTKVKDSMTATPGELKKIVKKDGSPRQWDHLADTVKIPDNGFTN